MKNKKIRICLAIILAIIICAVIIKTISKKDTANETQNNNLAEGTEDIDVTGKVNVTDEQTITDKDYSVEGNDESVVTTNENGNLVLENANITKTGDSSSLRNSDASGLNSAIRAADGSSMTITETTVYTRGVGASAIVATESGTTIEVSNTDITTNGERSRGILATRTEQQ